jgi:CHAT domain-containing protein
LEYEKVSDRYTRDLAAFYQTVLPKQRHSLIEAHQLMKEAFARYSQDEYETALNLYIKAKHLFKQAGSECESALAEIWIGISNLRIEPKESLRVLQLLAKRLEGRQYRFLLAQAVGGIADAKSSERAFSEVLTLGKLVFEISENIEDPSGMLRGLQLQVAMYQQFGDYSRSLGYISRAYDLADRFPPEPEHIWPFYHQAAFNLNSLRLPHAALAYQKEALRLAILARSPLLKSRSYARLGVIYEKLEDYDEAIKNGELALVESQSIESKKSRENIKANSTLNLAHLYRAQGDLRRAVTYYDEAIRIHNDLNIQLYVFEAHKGKLLSLIGLNDNEAAELEVKAAVELIEQYRSKILEESNRNGFFDLAQSIYDAAIAFSYTQMNNITQAFYYAESSHARSLLDLMKTNSRVVSYENNPDLEVDASTPPLTLLEIQQQLPYQTQVIEYSVLDDRVLIWAISNSGIKSEESKITANALNEKVVQYLDSVHKASADSYQETIERGKELYDLLISPIEPLLHSKDYLCVVPDKVLNYLPFAALVCPGTGRFFIEDHFFVLAPSSNIFLACTEQANKKVRPGSEKSLVVGNPDFDKSAFPDLPAALNEAKQVASLYKSSLLLVDREASEARVKREARQADVIHIASHYDVDDQVPLRSKLLLAREAEQNKQQMYDGFLQASEIYDMKLPRTLLVVLSACQTGIEHSYRGEGAISVARPFIKAGVPIVVASLWAVDSESTSELMINLHGQRKQYSTAEALRNAQLDMLKSPIGRYHHPYHWASFAAIGGYANF